jgi:O-antigen ligase
MFLREIRAKIDVVIPANPDQDRRFRRRSAVALALLLFFAVLTLWVPQRWALSLFQAGVFLLGSAWALRMMLRPYASRGHFLLIPFAGALLWGLIQLLAHTTIYRFDTWNAVLFWGTALVLVWLSVQIFADAEVGRAFLRAILYFAFGVSVVSVVQLLTSEGNVFWLFPSGYKDRVLGPFVYHNNYAAFIELLLPLAVLEAVRHRRRAPLFTLIAAVMYASVIASASRAGSILATVEIVTVLGLSLARGLVPIRRLGLAAVALSVLAAICTAVVGAGLLWTRMQQADPFVHRREMLLSALDMARARPWLGCGLGTFQTAYPAHALFDIGLIVNHAHNDWAEWLAEGGVPFLALLLSAALWSIRPAVRSIWGIGVLSVFLHAFVDYPMQRLGLAAWVFVMLGVLAAAAGDRVSAGPRTAEQTASLDFHGTGVT